MSILFFKNTVERENARCHAFTVFFDLSTSVSDRRFQFSGYEISQIMNDQSWNHLNINQGQI